MSGVWDLLCFSIHIWLNKCDSIVQTCSYGFIELRAMQGNINSGSVDAIDAQLQIILHLRLNGLLLSYKTSFVSRNILDKTARYAIWSQRMRTL